MVCGQVLAVSLGLHTDATYLLGLMAYTFGNLDPAVAHVRGACCSLARAGRLFQRFRRYSSPVAGLLAEAEQAARRSGCASAGLRPSLEHLGNVL